MFAVREVIMTRRSLTGKTVTQPGNLRGEAGFLATHGRARFHATSTFKEDM